MRYRNWEEERHVDKFMRVHNAQPRIFEVGFFDSDDNWRIIWDKMRPDQRRSIDFFQNYNVTRCSDVLVRYYPQDELFVGYDEKPLSQFLSCGLPDQVF